MEGAVHILLESLLAFSRCKVLVYLIVIRGSVQVGSGAVIVLDVYDLNIFSLASAINVFMFFLTVSKAYSLSSKHPFCVSTTSSIIYISPLK